MDVKNSFSSRRSPRNESIVPKHYDVHLTTDLDSGQFCGSVTIDLIVEQENQNSIKLDATQLVIDHSSISLLLSSTSKSVPCTVEYHNQLDLLEICLGENQRFSSHCLYRLIINSFSGHLNIDSQTGFYRSSVDAIASTQSGFHQFSVVKKHYGLTQMSPTHCRRVFPCFDEPSLRATFDLTLDIPRHMKALSNMPQQSVYDNFLNSGTKRIRFQRTPSMPTFLLCFVIGEFDVVQTEPVQRWKQNAELMPIELTAFTLPGRKMEATFALNCARQALHYYADLFQIEYPMAKLDLVAVPDLFYPAMENWALILFKEEEMLINEDHALSVQYRNVCQSVTHEIAHQWFGNLVSIHWWNDVYVVEGFAKWFEYLATDYIVPEYNVFAEFFSTQYLRYFDYCINVLHSEANELDEKDFSFEGFIYSKGSCLMRMLHLYLGQDNFLRSIRLFLHRYSYQAATAHDFWSCLEEITKLPIVELVQSWCTKKSYPVVEVQLIKYDESTGVYDLKLKQTSFCVGDETRQEENFENSSKIISCHCIQTDMTTTNRSSLQKSNSSASLTENWIVPITIFNGQSNDSLSKHLLREKEERIQIRFDSNQTKSLSDRNEPVRKKRRSLSFSSNWLKVNVCAGGPYRVLYSPNMLQQLIEAISRHELNAFDRFNLENDAYALAMGGFTSLVDYLRILCTAFIDETDDELVWKDIESNIVRIATLLEYDAELFEYYREFVIYFHRSLLERIGLAATPNESVACGRLRCYLLVILGTIGNDIRVINYAREQLVIYLSDNSINVLWPICAIVAHHASEMDFNNLFKLWEQRLRRDDRLRCAYGLSYVQDPSHIERVFELFATNSSVNSNHSHVLRLNERIECYKGFCLSKTGRHAFQRYVEENWLSLRMNYADEYLEALVRETFGYFSTSEEAKKIEEFFLFYEKYNEKLKSSIKETPSTPCTRIAVHLSLDDNELSSLSQSNIFSTQSTPTDENHRALMPKKVKEVASIIAHTTRTRAALLERDREKLLKYFQSESFGNFSVNRNSSSQIVSINIRSSSPPSGNKRKRRLSALSTSTTTTTSNSSSPSVRNLLASDTTA